MLACRVEFFLLNASLSIIALLAVVSCSLAEAQGPDYQAENQSAKAQAIQYYRLACQAEQAGDMNKAIELYKRSISFNPRIKEVHYALGKADANMGNNEEAMSQFRTALNIDSNFIACRNDYGVYLKSRGKIDEAQMEFKKCIQINPKFPYSYFNLGLILKDKGDLEGAIENLETACRLQSDFAEGQKELGLAIFERASGGDLNLAAQALERSAQLAPDNALVHHYLGFIYAAKSALDQAETEYRKALMCDSRLAVAHWELARLRYLRGDLDRCLVEIKEAQRVNPTYTSDHKYPAVQVLSMKTLYAQALEHKNKLIGAVDTYKELAHLRGSDRLYAKHIESLIKKIKTQQKEQKKHPLPYNPEAVEASVAQGIDQYEDGKLGAAKASFERALELNPESLEATLNLSSVQEAQGDLDAAVASNQKALQIDPTYDGAYYNLAYLLEKMHLPADAGAMYEKFHKIAGKYPYDPQHIIDLQQDIIRQEKVEENLKRRGY